MVMALRVVWMVPGAIHEPKILFIPMHGLSGVSLVAFITNQMSLAAQHSAWLSMMFPGDFVWADAFFG